MQIPVLVLSPTQEPITLVASSRFKVRLDEGPWFRPTHTRLEGGDPIALAILLDRSGKSGKLMPWIDSAIAELAPRSLQPQDRVSIYALDCALVQSLNNVPAEAGELKRGVEGALSSEGSGARRKKNPGCKQEVSLWDTLVYVTQQLKQLPGRRVILAVTDGQDKGSRNTWNDLRRFAAGSGVAIFGMKEPVYTDSGWPGFAHGRSEDAFDTLCQMTGGLVLTTGEENISERLKRFTAMLRGRYIVEFPRASNTTAGFHGLDVAIEKSNAFIRAAGISVPVADPRVLADPTTVPSDPSLAPEMGKRRILGVPH